MLRVIIASAAKFNQIRNYAALAALVTVMPRTTSHADSLVPQSFAALVADRREPNE